MNADVCMLMLVMIKQLNGKKLEEMSRIEECYQTTHYVRDINTCA
jgi:hypothetical protein